MADLSKIDYQGTDLNIKDVTARASAAKISSDMYAEAHAVNLTGWEQGTISASGSASNSSSRCRIKEFISFGEADRIVFTVAPTFQMSIREYTSADASSAVDHSSDGAPFSAFATGTFSITNVHGHFYRFVIARDITGQSGVSIVPSDVTDGTVTYMAPRIQDPYDFFVKRSYSVDAWVQGAIANNGNNTTSSSGTYNYTLRNQDPRIAFLGRAVGGKVTVKVKTGYQANILEFYDDERSTSSSNKSSTAPTDWFGGSRLVSVSDGKVYRVVIRKNQGADAISPSTDGVAGAVEFEWLEPIPVASNENIVTRNDPVTMLEKIRQLRRGTRTGSTQIGGSSGVDPLCLLWFSDIHGDKKRLENVIEFADYYSAYIDDVIHTGDSCEDSNADGISFWPTSNTAKKILNVVGNHDTKVDDTWIGRTMAQSYSDLLGNISYWGVESTADKTYYYKDYTKQNVRLIVLDVMHQSSDDGQLAWFTSTLAAAKTAGLHVLVAVHSRAAIAYTPVTTPWDDAPLVAEYRAGYTDSSSGTHPQNLASGYVEAVDDFIDDGGKFIAWIHGHTHHKMFAKITADTRQLDIAVAAAAQPSFAWTYVGARITGTKCEDDFNLLAVDTVSGIIKLVKVGADYDHCMRHTDTICWDYVNGQLVYSN